jgi:hypothetical protein
MSLFLGSLVTCVVSSSNIVLFFMAPWVRIFRDAF